MLNKTIVFCFYLLFAITPLIFLRYNYELFEYNKMMFVYLLTTVITSIWILKMINTKKWLVERTPLDVPILLFFISQLLSTIFSIDIHTSIWGYYSRSNGGLLSIVSYLLLYYAFVSNFKAQTTQIIKFLKAILFGGLITSLWAIPEHFGVSPSCALLVGRWTDNCWQQDVQARVFSTLGQPNWLAAYLGMLIFIVIYFLIQSKTKLQLFISYLLLLVFYMAFTFTYSRGATLGLIAGLMVFVAFQMSEPIKKLILSIKTHLTMKSSPTSKTSFDWLKSVIYFKQILTILLLFLIVNLLYGSAVTRFQLITQSKTAPTQASQASVTQLENGGTESSQIRLIVWRGAIDIFRHYPIFGSGVETFAYSYYQFRPVEHNLVSEWDFLYNKAHNEYLNYLATTGILGFGSYILLITIFTIWSIRYYLFKAKSQSLNNNSSLLIACLLAGYISYLIQNIFQFSVVMIAVLFYLFPVFIFSFEDKTEFWPFPKLELGKLSTLFNLGLTNRLFLNLKKLFIVLVTLFICFTLIKYWLADTKFALGSSLLDQGETGRGYNDLIDAVYLNPKEPFYRSELGYAAAAAASALADKDATLSAALKSKSIGETQISLQSSPNNVSYWKTAVRTYLQLSSIDSSYNQKTVDALDKSISLAPTDAKLYYEKALVLSSISQDVQAEGVLKQAIVLKPNYRDAHYALGVTYQSLGQNNLAISEFKIVLKLIPNDPEATEKLKNLGS